MQQEQQYNSLQQLLDGVLRRHLAHCAAMTRLAPAAGPAGPRVRERCACLRLASSPAVFICFLKLVLIWGLRYVEPFKASRDAMRSRLAAGCPPAAAAPAGSARRAGAYSTAAAGPPRFDGFQGFTYAIQNFVNAYRPLIALLRDVASAARAASPATRLNQHNRDSVGQLRHAKSLHTRLATAAAADLCAVARQHGQAQLLLCGATAAGCCSYPSW